MGKSRRPYRRCVACQAPCPPRYGIPDPCLGQLPGLTAACCGHGSSALCYVQEGAARTVRGAEAWDILRAKGGNPAPFITDKRHPGHLPGWYDTEGGNR